MKRLAIASIAVWGVMMGGCAQVSDAWLKVTGTDLTVANVLALTLEACQALPTVSSVANLISNGNFVVAEQVAQTICSALPASATVVASAKMGDGTPFSVTIRGVTVTGTRF
jgi:hypothetical protein